MLPRQEHPRQRSTDGNSCVCSLCSSSCPLANLTSPPPHTHTVSAFTYPLWFFQSQRDKPQISLLDAELIIPYDEFVTLQHVFVERANAEAGIIQMDMFYYFELLLGQYMEGFQVRSVLPCSQPPCSWQPAALQLAG